MPGRPDIQATLGDARRRGYFDVSFVRGTFRPEELRELYLQLDRAGIPLEAPKIQVDRGTAVSIINALRVGAVPQTDLSALSVGRIHLLKQLEDDLRGVEKGESRVRFLSAGYGSGKTHSLRILGDKALKSGFAVSFVTLTPRDSPLHSLLKMYAAAIAGIHTSQAGLEGLDALLTKWVDLVRTQGEELSRRQIANLPAYLVSALAEFAGATVNPVRRNEERRHLILRYLGGRGCTREELRLLGVERAMSEGSALRALEDMTRLIRQLGFRGLCVFFDEAESILSVRYRSTRYLADRNLSRLIQDGPKLKNCYFVYATTPAFFDDQVSSWSKTIKRAHIYEPEPLTGSDFQDLARRIGQIHGAAYDYDPRLSALMETVDVLSARVDGPGSFVRAIVNVLDRDRRQ